MAEKLLAWKMLTSDEKKRYLALINKKKRISESINDADKKASPETGDRFGKSLKFLATGGLYFVFHAGRFMYHFAEDLLTQEPSNYLEKLKEQKGCSAVDWLTFPSPY